MAAATSSKNGGGGGSSAAPDANDANGLKRSRKDDIDVSIGEVKDDDEPAGAGAAKKKGGSAKVKEEDASGLDAARTGRACLACRKLKTKCEEADSVPCKRCRLGGHECIFVESKRGKRPARKATDATLAEKFRNVEKTLSVLLQSMSTGAPPDPSALAQLQQSLAEGTQSLAAAESKSSTRDRRSPDSGSDQQVTCKRLRRESSDPQNLSPASPFFGSNLSPSTAPPTGRLPQLSLDTTPHILGHAPLPALGGSGGGLGMLAEASLAAQIDGRTTMKGLDPTFNLSRVTEALEENRGGVGAETSTPPLLSKGIVSPELAVQLFKFYFEWCYIHVPFLDPEIDTATSVCARSPFLFTVICAVASRFHTEDRNLHIACYDEAHEAFLEMIRSGHRSIENCQGALILTAWGSAPKGAEDRPQRASLYFGMAVRMALELGLFRAPAWVDQHLAAGNAGKAAPWANIKGVSEAEQRDALNRERTWLLVFVIDRHISAVMGRPYQVHETKPLLLPLHPLSLPFDLGLIAHAELQLINGQVMDTFRERIYGLASNSDEMPSPVVMKISNSRMDEWRQRWCPVPGEPIANILLFYFHSSKLFLNTIPLHTMLRSGDVSDDPECVSTCLDAATNLLDLGHEYAKLGVLAHCPDVNFLLMLYAAVFLVKLKVSNTRFAELVNSEDLERLLSQAIQDSHAATFTDRHAAATSHTLLRAVLASWKALVHGGSGGPSRATSLHGGEHGMAYGSMEEQHSTLGLGLQGTLAGFSQPSGPNTPAPYPFLHSPFSASRQNPGGYFQGSHSHAPSLNGDSMSAAMEPLDGLGNFLSDTGFWGNILVPQGADGFFSWTEGLDTANGLDLDFGALEASLGVAEGAAHGDVTFTGH